MPLDPMRLLDLTQLDETTLPAFRDGALNAEAAGITHTLRTYPGHQTVALPAPKQRLLTRLDATLLGRRSTRDLDTQLPDAKTLGALLGLSFGITGPMGRSPAPSAGGLQSLCLYSVVIGDGWLEQGAWHYERAAHALARLDAPTDPQTWCELLVSSRQFTGGALLFIIVGDGRAIGRKYGPRAARFLLLEAGHVMQNLCLVSSSLGLCTLPLGGVLDNKIAGALSLLPTDRVLYAGVCGRPV